MLNPELLTTFWTVGEEEVFDEVLAGAFRDSQGRVDENEYEMSS